MMVGGVVMTTPSYWGRVPVMLLPARVVSNVVCACSVVDRLGAGVALLVLLPLLHPEAVIVRMAMVAINGKKRFMFFCVFTARKRSE